MDTAKATLLGVAFFFLNACSNSNWQGYPLTETGLRDWGARHNFTYHAHRVEHLAPAGYLIRQPALDHNILAVYIEGDGASWASPYHPPSDPTPSVPVALLLANSQPFGVASYIPRPCQFALHERCRIDHWTTGRFSAEVIAGYLVLLDSLRIRFPLHRIILVGYSGGGIIASLLMGQRVDIDRVITIASPLDLSAWLDYHEAKGMLSFGVPMPGNNDSGWARVFQVFGATDSNVPVQMAFKGEYAVAPILVGGADHECCWLSEWPNLFATLVKQEIFQ